MLASSAHRISFCPARRRAVLAPRVMAGFRRLDYLLAVLVLLGSFYAASQVFSIESSSMGQQVVDGYRTPAGLLAAAIASEVPPADEVTRSQ